MAKQQDFFKTQIRIPSDIYGAIKDAAEESGRSINAEIIELFLIGLGEKEPPINSVMIRKIIREELQKISK
ncbi:Arc family DNA-binding protein [Leucothrix mucor]|uniref:Arc family DNA-binding protein n=1 Tax=Leucothrix mucor TaxID=45248 RepID=UPI0003B58147|nr:Arc family DNA-binding protein [Leucothrix mucor]